MHKALFPAFRFAPLRARRSWCAALVGCGALALVAGCGSATAAPGTAAAAAAPSASPAAASRTAYVACLRQHGADVPTAIPTTKPTTKPTAGAAGSRKGTDAIPAAARQACASLRPSAHQKNTAQKNTAVEAFDACMAAHGETIPARQPAPTASAGSTASARPTTSAVPTAAARPTGTARFLHGLNPANAQVAAALKACESKLPTILANG
jgi:hypothetical protein